MTDNAAVIAVRVDADQHARIKTAAKRAGVPMSTWVRMCALLHAENVDQWKNGVFDAPTVLYNSEG